MNPSTPAATESIENVLLLPSHEATLKEMLYTAEALAATGRYRCTFVITWPCSKRWLYEIDQRGHGLILKGRSLGFGGKPAKRAVNPPTATPSKWKGIARSVKSALKRSLQAVLRLMLLESVLSFAESWFRYARRILLARRLLRRVDPRLVIVPSDRLVGLETALIVEARKRNIASLVIPWAVSVSRGSALYRIGQPNFENRYGMKRLVNRLVAKWFPLMVREESGHKVLFLPGEVTLAAMSLGIMNPCPWRFVGGGLATRTAVDGRRFYEEALEQGVPSERLVATGRVSTDSLYRTRADAVEHRRRLCRKLNFDAESPILLCSVPNLGEHDVCSWEEHWRETEFLFGVMGSLEGVNVVLSLHPKSNPADYREIAARHGAVIAMDDPIERLMPLCDLFVSTLSSTVLLAIGCRKPVVLLDIYGMGYDLFSSCPGAVTVRRKEEVLPALRHLFEDRRHYAELVRQQDEGAEGWIQADGKCTERIIAEADALVFGSRSSTTGSRSAAA